MSQDYFAVLGEARRPWISGDELKAKFLAISATAHPDRNPEASSTSPDFATVNEAYNVLRGTPARLAHLLELERGMKEASVQSVPSELMDWAFDTGALLRESELFLAEKARNSSPMIAVQHFQKGMEFTDRLNLMRARIQQALAELDEELKEMNARWLEAFPVGHEHRAGMLPLERLREIFQRSSFLARWRAQIDEKIAALAI